MRFTHLSRFADGRKRNLLAEAFRNGIYIRCEPEKRTKGSQLATEGNGFDGITTLTVAFSSPHPVSVEFATTEITEIVDSFLVTPLRERFQSITVTFESAVREFILSTYHIPFNGFTWRDRLEVGHESPRSMTNASVSFSPV
jgi:hypothetical protein